MHLLYKKNIAPNLTIGITQSDKIKPELLKKHPRGKRLLQVGSRLRQKQCSGAIALIQHLLQKDTIELQHDAYGKPYLNNPSQALSISYSREHVAVLLSNSREVGVDLEKIDNRIKRIAPRFLNKPEWNSLSNHEQLAHLTTYWCAKEALYKIYGKRKLRFKEHLRISPFKFEETGTITGTLQKDEGAKEYELTYKKITPFILCYTYDK